MNSNILQQIKNNFQKDVVSVYDLNALRNLEIKYLGRNSELTQVLRSLKELSPEEIKIMGARANFLRSEIDRVLKDKAEELKAKQGNSTLEKEWIDVTMPNIKGLPMEMGHTHPISQIQYEIEDIFASMGFMVLDGPELESDYYNFEALNIPSWHPARDMQDTFYIENQKSFQYGAQAKIKNQNGENNLVLRTQTSSVQVRALERYGAPIRAIVPGRVFRSEATDASHEHTFYQVEGLMVDKNISIANLIAVMKTLLKEIFKRDVKVRLRPGYFPFVEPAFELDINCLICGGGGCSVCKHNGWLELLPCGMVHPNVLRAGGVDSKEYSGFAFGLGLNRLVMMKYGIDDIRLFMSGDLRFLEQF